MYAFAGGAALDVVEIAGEGIASNIDLSLVSN
jgi:hypothetical protein